MTTQNIIGLTDAQKTVLSLIFISNDKPRVAAEDIRKGGVKLKAAQDLLADPEKFKDPLITVDDQGPTLTDEGKQIMRDEGLLDDNDELTDEGNTFAYGEEGAPPSSSTSEPAGDMGMSGAFGESLFSEIHILSKFNK